MTDTSRCPRCHSQVITGHSNGGKAVSLDVTLDPDPLDVAGELHHLMAGHRTWTLHTAGEIHARTPATIATKVAGRTPRQTVHAGHHCQPLEER